jgi:hypothetical protein
MKFFSTKLSTKEDLFAFGVIVAGIGMLIGGLTRGEPSSGVVVPLALLVIALLTLIIF